MNGKASEMIGDDTIRKNTSAIKIKNSVYMQPLKTIEHKASLMIYKLFTLKKVTYPYLVTKEINERY